MQRTFEDYLFVYGTLRRETATGMHRLLAQYSQFISEGYMFGHLYEIDGYPGAIENSDEINKVHGEIYKVDNPEIVLKELDEYEECTNTFPEPREYERKHVSVALKDGGFVTAWAYLYNHDTSSRKEIASGDYLQHLTRITTL